MTLDVLATGYPSLDYILPVSHSPKVGETALLSLVPSDSVVTYGGCGINVAVALTKLGFRTGVAVVLGSDYLGSLYLSYLNTLHIDVTDVISLPDGQTSRSYLFRNPDGEYQNFFFPGAADAWRGTLSLQTIRHARYAVVTVGAYHYNKQFVEIAVQSGVPLIWELKPDVFAFPIEGMQRFAQASSYILMNHIEYAFIAEALGLESPSHLLNERTQAVVVTRGAEGCQVYTREGVHPVAAVPPAQVVDTTGAGDAFTAGFLAGLLRKYDVRISAQMGSVMASFVLEQIGCQNNLPVWSQMSSRYVAHFGRP